MTAAHPQARLPLPTRVCALVLAWQVFFVGLLAASPELHEYAHHGTAGEDHTCAVALFHLGLVPLAAAPVAVEPLVVVWIERLFGSPIAVLAAPAVSLPPPCGPPRA